MNNFDSVPPADEAGATDTLSEATVETTVETTEVEVAVAVTEVEVAAEVDAEMTMEAIAADLEAEEAIVAQIQAEVEHSEAALAEAEAQAAAAAKVAMMTEEERNAYQLRILEAILFAASSPLDVATITTHMNRGLIGQGADVPALLAQYKESLKDRGFMLLESSGRFSLRTSSDLADYLRTETVKPVKLSRAMSETLAIIAYHQPITRAEVESIRGVATSKGTLDYLMQLGWVRPGRRLETPGRPLTWITTPAFLDHFSLGSKEDLPGMDELKAAGLLDSRVAGTYGVINPSEIELPEAIESTVESEPEFLPSEETVAEQLADETSEEVEKVAADDSDFSEDDDDAEMSDDEEMSSDEDDSSDSDDEIEASDDDDDSDDDFDDDDDEEMSDDDFDDEDGEDELKAADAFDSADEDEKELA